MPQVLSIGAPGVYLQAPGAGATRLGVRMDVCAFVGVAPRGPARVPILDETWRFDRPFVEPDRPRRRSAATAVESFDEYRRLYGGFEGPGRLPYAVASYFEQGGRKAYVVRIVHDYANGSGSNEDGVARGVLPIVRRRLDLLRSGAEGLHVASDVALAAGSWLRCSLPGGRLAYRVVAAAALEVDPGSGTSCRVELHDPLGATPWRVELLHSLEVRARNEGAWGNRLRAGFEFRATPIQVRSVIDRMVVLRDMTPLPPGTTLRFRSRRGIDDVRAVVSVGRVHDRDPREDATAVELEAGLPALSAGDVWASVDLIEGVALVADGAGVVERHEGLGFCVSHPRFLATVLCNESELVYPTPDWAYRDVPLDAAGISLSEPMFAEQDGEQFSGGVDRFADITPEDFFDPGWVSGDAEPGDGIHALTHLSDLSSVVVPDLYSPAPLVEIEAVPVETSLARATFDVCVDVPQRDERPAGRVAELCGLRKDPRSPAELREITELQQRLEAFADQQASFVLLLDVPPGIGDAAVRRWRAAFQSSYLAAYHPWLKVARLDDRREALIRVPPSAIAAGIIARQEGTFGVPHGPANALARGVVDVDERISSARHDALHPLGINVYLRENDGVRLTSARTLSRDPQYRQLTVRRLMLMLRRVLEQQLQGLVFEPNDASLRASVRRLLRALLREWFRDGAFAGATEEESFFVRCDEKLNPMRIVDSGKLVAEIGVAPSEPLEFIVVRLVHDADGTRLTEA